MRQGQDSKHGNLAYCFASGVQATGSKLTDILRLTLSSRESTGLSYAGRLRVFAIDLDFASVVEGPAGTHERGRCAQGRCLDEDLDQAHLRSKRQQPGPLSCPIWQIFCRAFD